MGLGPMQEGLLSGAAVGAEAASGHGATDERPLAREAGPGRGLWEPTHPISFWGAPGKLYSPSPKDPCGKHGTCTQGMTAPPQQARV